MLDLDERCLCLRRYLDHSVTIDDFDTLRAFDEARYRQHERASRLDDPAYEGKPYRGSFFFHDARLSVGGRYRPVWLSMAAGYLYARLCDTSSTLLEQRIPYRYIPGRYHGRIEGRYRRWEMRIAANGSEAIVEQLLQRIWTYEQQRLDTLLTHWDTTSHLRVYFVQNPDAAAPKTHIVLSDKSALERIRPRFLLEDCLSLKAPACALEEAVTQEKVLLTQFISAQYAELAQTDGANVVRFRQRYSILMPMP